MRILTSAQMRSIEARATEEFEIPSIVLMENAAIGVVETILNHYPDAFSFSIFCGPGQNGGDGFAVARHLFNRGMDVQIWLIGPRDRIRDAARTNLTICEKSAIPVTAIEDVDDLERAGRQASETDLLIDAILGTGIDRPAEGIFRATIEKMNDLPVATVAIDLPSGLDGSTHLISGAVVRADLTVTFANPKIPHVFPPASGFCGEVVVADISIPAAAVEAEGVTLFAITPESVASLIPRRAADSHKGTFGHTMIVAGSAGKSGAAILSARGAARGGSGLVSVVTDEQTASLVDAVSLESMTFHSSVADPASWPEVLAFLNRGSCVVIGPGLADAEESYAGIRHIVHHLDRPMVLDASAVNAFAGAASTISGSAVRVLTPHPGELGRLLGIPVDHIQNDRIQSIRDAASDTGCVVVLKGHQTLVASPEGLVAVNLTGNPGMAAGGSGDVLAGLVGALISQGLSPFDASCAAVHLHGTAGDLIASEFGEVGMTAADLAEKLPAAFQTLQEHVD